MSLDELYERERELAEEIADLERDALCGFVSRRSAAAAIGRLHEELEDIQRWIAEEEPA